MSLPREGSRDTSEGIVISICPDVCLTPVGAAMVPVPYSIVAKQSDDAGTATSVLMTGMRTHTTGSIITTCTGDEPGTGKGIKSGTVEDICEPKTFSAKVRAEGKNVIRHNDEWWMNNRNTVGRLLYVKASETKKNAGVQYAAMALPKPIATDASPPAPKPPANDNNPYIRGNVDSPGWLRWVGRVTPVGAFLNAFFYIDPGAGAYLEGKVPHDPFEKDLYDKAVEAINKNEDPYEVAENLGRDLDKHRKEKGANTLQSASDDEVTINRDPCKVGPFDKLKCPDGQYRHHLVPDYVLRYGARRRTRMRIGNMPTLGEGPSICVDGHSSVPGTEHNRFHDPIDQAIANLGDEYGLTTLGEVLKEVKRLSGDVKPGCRQQIEDGIDKAFEGKDMETLVKTMQQPLVPSTPPPTNVPDALP